MTFATPLANAIDSLIVVLILALVHLYVKELRRIGVGRRNALLSAGAGASLAYVLMRILPKLADMQDSLMAGIVTSMRGFLEHHAYLIAMAGLVVFYGVSRVSAHGASGAGSVSPRHYRLALISTVVGYGAYSLLIGYLIVERLHIGLFSTALIAIGMGTLFLVSDQGLRKKWPDDYDDWIRWVLTGALMAGWALGVWVDVSPNIVALWYAFLAGLMLMATIGEKLAIEESGSFWPFLAGVASFTALLLILEQLPQIVL